MKHAVSLSFFVAMPQVGELTSGDFLEFRKMPMDVS